jgi:DNA-binding ferritin-like protein
MQGAHHAAKGVSFHGDHAGLYGQIYEEVNDSIDGLIERAIGVCNDEFISCPIAITENTVIVLKEWESPAGKSATTLAELALKYTEELVQIGEGTLVELRNVGCLSVGTENLIAGYLDTHESYVYLLKQRVKT